MRKLVLEQLFQLSNRFALWLVLGNAAALFGTFNALQSIDICDPEVFRSVALSFAWGIALAFFGAALNFFVGFYAAFMVNNSINTLTETATKVVCGYPESKAMDEMRPRFERMQKTIWIFPVTLVITVALYGASAASALNGVLIASSPAAIACFAATPS